MDSNDRLSPRVPFLGRVGHAARTLRDRAIVFMALDGRTRAVATPVAELSDLLARQGRSIQRLHQLRYVERALRNHDGLDSVPDAVLRGAAEQLDALAITGSPGLGVLRLQMRRQIVADEARKEDARNGRAVNWRPRSGGAQVAPRRAGATFFDSLFDPTEPQTTIPMGHADAEVDLLLFGTSTAHDTPKEG